MARGLASDLRRTSLSTRPSVARAVEDADLPALRSLMERYRDRPMAFADATLVHLGSKLGLADIMTIDHDAKSAGQFCRHVRRDQAALASP
jgi:predicted nucleic acid-binding protein